MSFCRRPSGVQHQLNLFVGTFVEHYDGDVDVFKHDDVFLYGVFEEYRAKYVVNRVTDLTGTS